MEAPRQRLLSFGGLCTGKAERIPRYLDGTLGGIIIIIVHVGIVFPGCFSGLRLWMLLWLSCFLLEVPRLPHLVMHWGWSKVWMKAEAVGKKF